MTLLLNQQRSVKEYSMNETRQVRSCSRRWFGGKICVAAMITGMLVSYNELVLDAYSKLSYVNHSNLDANSVQFLAKKLPTYEHLAKQTSNGYWRQLRAWDNLDRFVLRESGRSNTKLFKKNDKSSLTNTILARPGGIVIEPIIFKNMKENMTVTIVHAGDKLCGYPFLVHGGIIATFLNETFKRNASLCSLSQSSMKDDYMVKSLSITYKAPTLANQFLIIKTRTSQFLAENGHLESSSTIETSTGKVLVICKAKILYTGRASLMAAEKEAKKWTIL